MLKVSRSGIETKYIIDFPKEKRFIELPVDKYLQLLDIEPNAPQKAIVNAINDPKYRFVCAAISRRLGKTFIANIIGQLKALVPETNVLIMSPNYNLSQISFEEQRKLLKKFDIEIYKDNLKERILELQNGSTIRMGSVNQVDSAVGRSYDLIIFDEAALTSEGEAAFNVALRPTLDKVNPYGEIASKAIFISTPRGKNNWFSRFFARGFDTERFQEWVSIHADYKENPRATEHDIEEAKSSMSEAEFNQEYLASFNVFEGQIFKFNNDECVRDLSEMDFTDMDTIAGLDIGYRDPTFLVVLKYDYRTETYYIVDEYESAEAVTSQHADVIKEKENKWNIDAIFIDSAAAQAIADLAYEHDIVTTPAKKSLLDGIAFVQNLIEKDKVIVDYRCTKILEMLDQYRWDDNSNLLRERPVHDKYSHGADALRYAIYSYVVTTGQI